MIFGIHPEVLLTTGYALLLILIAAGLEALARLSHRRSLQYQTAGFTYQHQRDAWKCPVGQELLRVETDHARRVAHYRAPAHACNTCGVKPQCTDSHQGREIERPLDAWLVAEVSRFHRGISLTLLLLATLILVAEILRYNRPPDLIILGGLLAPISTVGVRLFAVFLAH
ncbi:MAG: hypothetical protein LAP13_26910 [Acidobacteriia bacterium]|nr:hypothetical protein [Terriglobia bacterium]